MNDDNPILYYAPRTRASGVLTLLRNSTFLTSCAC